MGLIDSARTALDRIAESGALRMAREREYESVFAANRDRNLFRGVFDTFDAAQSSAPPTLPLGYDNPASAAMYMDRTRKTYPTDYPVMFWLAKLIAEGCRTLFDLGGHVGVSYYAYRRYLDYPAQLRWTVHDVPAVMEQGRRIAAEKDADRRLDFADSFDAAGGKDILMALGSLQYLPETLAQRLAQLTRPPRNLVLNLTPIHERDSYFTLQSVGTAFCPYRITAAGEFFRQFDELGYTLVDTWENPDKKCEIPFHADRSLERYHGFFYRRKG